MALWYNLEPSEDGGTPDSGTLFFNGNEVTSTYFDGDTGEQVSEIVNFEMIDGYIDAPQTSDGPLEVYKSSMPFNIATFDGDVILVMIKDNDTEGGYEPELWFRI